jgi:uncharacterized PurR-regulated membrane protein YhhQ (DUF165 family)
MKYKWTLLNIPTFLFLLGCVIYTISKYSILSSGEGWGVAYMIGIFIFGSTALIVDLIIQRAVGSKDKQVIINLIALLGYVVLFFLGN